MLDSTSDSQTSSSQNSFPYKIIFGYLNHIDDFETINDDPVHAEIMRVNTELVARLRRDYPDRGIVLDISTVVEALPTEVI